MSIKRSYSIGPWSKRDELIVEKRHLMKYRLLTAVAAGDKRKADDQSDYEIKVISSQGTADDVPAVSDDDVLLRHGLATHFQMEVGGAISINKVLGYIAEVLAIQTFELVIYPSTDVDVAKTYSSKPYLFYESASVVGTFFSDGYGKKIANGRHSPFYLKYRVLPFRLLQPIPKSDDQISYEMLQDFRSTHRFLDISIADHMTRQWRRKFIAHQLHSVDDHSDKRLRNEEGQVEGTPSESIGTSSSDSQSSEVEPIWPALTSETANSHDFLSENKVYARFDNELNVGDCMRKLRQYIGIPSNIGADGTLTSAGETHLDSGNSEVMEEEEKVADISHSLNDDELIDGANAMDSESSGTNPLNSTTSSLGSKLRRITPTVVQSSAIFRSRKHDIISENDVIYRGSNSIPESSLHPYPLALLQVRGNIIIDVFLHSLKVIELPASW